MSISGSVFDISGGNCAGGRHAACPSEFEAMRDINMSGKSTIEKVGAMQPYLFPYLGYFQLISAVDAFVLGDDLQYVKESWINRNRILVNRKEKLVSFPLKKSGHLARINEKFFSDDFPKMIEDLLKQLRNAYANARSFSSAYPVLEAILCTKEDNLARYAEHSIRAICNYLEIRTPIYLSSSFSLDVPSHKQERVVNTVRKLNGSVYVNPIGGLALYDEAYFNAHGIELRFHRMNDFQYEQLNNPFVPCLSIIDVLMFNSREKVMDMLYWYVLEDQAGNCRSTAQARYA